MSRQFVIIPSKAFFDEAISPAQLRVLGTLGYHTDKNGWCNPGVETMASLLGVSHGSVSKCLSALERMGYVDVIRNKRTGNRYHVVSRFEDVPEGTSDVPLEGTSVVPPIAEQEREQERELSPSGERAPSIDAVMIRQAMETYNTIAHHAGWPKALSLNKERRTKLRGRLKDAGGTLQGWVDALQRAERSSFLTGSNQRGWRPNIDFFLQPSSFTKLLEGYYDDRPSNNNGGRAGDGGRRHHILDTLAEIASGLPD